METETKLVTKVKKRLVVKKKAVKKIVTPEGSPTKSDLSQSVPVPVSTKPKLKVKSEPAPEPKSRVELVDDYLRDMSDLERKTMEIAQSHLGSSFNLDKSVGFLEWLSSREEG